MAITRAPGWPNFANQKPFVTRFTKESLCTIRLFFFLQHENFIFTKGIKNSEVFYHDVVAMTHTHLSIVGKQFIFL